MAVRGSIGNLLYGLVTVCLLVAGGGAAAAPAMEYSQLTVAGEILSQPVSSIVRDRDGFVWIASRGGISRYDGRNTKTYRLSPTTIQQDHDGRELGVRYDAAGVLWAFTDSGRIYRYDALRDAFEPIVDVGDHIPSIHVRDLQSDGRGTLWIGSAVGLLRCTVADPAGIVTAASPDAMVNCIVPIDSTTLALGTSRGMRVAGTRDPYPIEASFCEGENIMSIHYDAARQRFWIGTFSSGLFAWDIAAGRYLDADYLRAIPKAPVKAIRPWGGEGGQMLVGLDGRGVYKVDPVRGTAEPFLSNDDRHNNILRANNVYDILVDEGNIWVGTYTGGVTIVRRPGPFEWIRHTPHDRQTVNGTHVYAICEDRDGDLWYATDNGVSLCSKQTGLWRHFLENRNSFLTLTEDRDGRIWAGGYSTGLYCIDKRRGVVRYIPSTDGGSQLDCIYASAQDADGDLWFGKLYTPLVCISDPNTPRESHKVYKDITQVKAVVPIDGGRLLIATYNGFYLLDKRSGVLRRYFGSPSQSGVVSNSFIFTGVITGDEIWFGTDGGGLNCMNLRTEQAVNFSTDDGLPSNFIYGIQRDEEGILWVSTNNGLFCFDSRSRQFLYTVDDLPMKEFLFSSHTRLRDGRMAFGGIDGAIFFDPRHIRREQASVALHFTDFRLFYRSVVPAEEPSVLPEPIDRLNHVTLRHDQNSFAFEFIAVDPYNPDRYTYSYILEGFDREWTPNGDRLSVNYTNIAPGDYSFRIRCFDRNGDGILAERRIGVTVRAPFWDTPWAWLLYLAVFGALAYWVWCYYRERMLKRQSRERINFFINVAHDLRTPLSLVLAPLSDLEEEELSPRGRGHLRLAQQNGRKLFSLMSQLIDFHKEELSATRPLHLQLCDLREYLTRKKEEFAALAAEKELAICTELPDEAVLIQTHVQKLDRILDNLLSNAVKYSNPGGRIVLRLRENRRQAVIEVEDFGIGIAKAEQKKVFKEIFRTRNAVNMQEVGAGIGLVYTRRLAQQIRAELSFVSREGCGTTFFLALPKNETPLPPGGAKPASGQIPAEAVRLPAASYSILIVEDNADMRGYLQSILAPEYKLYGAASAEEALAFLEKNSVDLMISDIMMEGMPGDELCRVVKRNIATSHIHVILLTAVTEKERMLASMEYGADDYITKPFVAKLLRMKIHNFLRTRRRLQQYYLTKNNLPGGDAASETPAAPQPAAAGIDERFLSNCIRIAGEHLADPEFTIDRLCQEIAMSRTLVYGKLKALTGQSPNEFIRAIRLSRARELLESGHPIAETAAETGFSDAKYFSTVYKKYYGISPSQVAKR